MNMKDSGKERPKNMKEKRKERIKERTKTDKYEGRQILRKNEFNEISMY